MLKITAEEVNFIIYQYLHESGMSIFMRVCIAASIFIKILLIMTIRIYRLLAFLLRIFPGSEHAREQV